MVRALGAQIFMQRFHIQRLILVYGAAIGVNSQVTYWRSIVYKKVCGMSSADLFEYNRGTLLLNVQDSTSDPVGRSSAWRHQQHPLTAPEIRPPWTRASSTSCRAWEWPGDEGRRQDTSGNRRAAPVTSSRTWCRTADTKTQPWNTQCEDLLPAPETRNITS
jgi:hypothetical protein